MRIYNTLMCSIPNEHWRKRNEEKGKALCRPRHEWNNFVCVATIAAWAVWNFVALASLVPSSPQPATKQKQTETKKIWYTRREIFGDVSRRAMYRFLCGNKICIKKWSSPCFVANAPNVYTRAVCISLDKIVSLKSIINIFGVFSVFPTCFGGWSYLFAEFVCQKHIYFFHSEGWIGVTYLFTPTTTQAYTLTILIDSG